MTTSKSTDVYHVTARVFLSNQPLLILEIYCAFVDCCKLENLIKAMHVYNYLLKTSPLAFKLAAVMAIFRNVGRQGTNCWLLVKRTTGKSVVSLIHDSCFFGKKENIFQFPHYPFETSCQLLIFQIIQFRETLNNNRDLTQ